MTRQQHLNYLKQVSKSLRDDYNINSETLLTLDLVISDLEWELQPKRPRPVWPFATPEPVLQVGARLPTMSALKTDPDWLKFKEV